MTRNTIGRDPWWYSWLLISCLWASNQSAPFGAMAVSSPQEYSHQQLDPSDTEWGRAIDQPTEAKIQDPQKQQVDIEDYSSYEHVDVAIVGGGLCGLLVAIGLARENPSLTTCVLERAPRLRSDSQGILAVQPNGMKALASIDPVLPEMVRTTGCERETLWITHLSGHDDRRDEHHETGTAILQKYGLKKVGITWHNMQQILANRLIEVADGNSIIRTGHALSHFVELEDEEEGIVLYFDDPTIRPIRAHVVVACDGVFSAARRQLDATPPLWFHQLNWGTIVRSHLLPPKESHAPNQVHYVFMEQDEANKKKNQNIMNNDPDTNDEADASTPKTPPRWMAMLNDGGYGYTFFQFRVSDPLHANKLSGNGGRGGLGLPGVKERLIRLAQKHPHALVVRQALEAIPEESLFERSIVGRTPLSSSWLSPKGRLALVGDSAHGMHPNIAQGANQAFESAAVLIDTLRRTRRNPFRRKNDTSTGQWLQRVLRDFDARRRPRATLIQQYATCMGLVQSTGQQFVKDAPLREEMMDWILSNDPSRAPPTAVVDFLKGFDPLKHGASFLW